METSRCLPWSLPGRAGPAAPRRVQEKPYPLTIMGARNSHSGIMGRSDYEDLFAARCEPIRVAYRPLSTALRRRSIPTEHPGELAPRPPSVGELETPPHGEESPWPVPAPSPLPAWRSNTNLEPIRRLGPPLLEGGRSSCALAP